MRKTPILGVLTCSLMTAVASCTALVPVADKIGPAQNSNRIASFSVRQNLPSDANPDTATSAEIIAATEDGMTLVYTDGPLGAVGFVDLTDPTAPAPGGIVKVKGKPTSVAVNNGKAYVVVETSERATKPPGYLAVINITSRVLSKSCDLDGRPGSVAISDGGASLTVAIEYPRDDDPNDDRLSQVPLGHVAIVPLMNGQPDCDGLKIIGPRDVVLENWQDMTS